MAFIDPIHAAVERRAADIERWSEEESTCYRLFHGAVEGIPGLAIDRYGPIALAQTWREPLTESQFIEIQNWTEHRGLMLVWNDRSRRGDVQYQHGVELPSTTQIIEKGN